MITTSRTRLRLAIAGVGGAAIVVAGLVALGTRDSDRGVEAPAGAQAVEPPVISPDDVQLSHDDTQPVSTAPVKGRKLRAGEQRTTLQIPAAYTPSPPTGTGTDDYRCFLLDPGLSEDAWLTGTQILPGNAEIVHHVILFRVDGDSVAQAEAEDAQSPEPGWTCFGGMGLEGEFNRVDDAGWLGAWAPGGRETLVRDGYGVSLDSGTKIVMQVHYNLLLGDAPDQSATQIRWRPKADSVLTPIHTTLLPAPVELPCRPQHELGALCDRDASIADAKKRFGESAGQTANLLHLLCGSNIYATTTTSCTREIPRGMTILGAAGHMHLLGRWIRIEANPGTPEATQVLEIPLWNFDDQGAKRIKPLHLDAGDTLRVTCHHEQDLRDLLPAFEGTQEKYIVWAEGTTDEMCLGILQVVFDDEA